MKNGLARFISVLLLGAMLLGVAACSEPADNNVSDNAATTAGDTTAAETGDTRFLDTDYDGREFRVYTSVNDDDATNANALIEGSGEQNGDTVNDAVYTRNQTVEDLLNIKFAFTESDFDYNSVKTAISSLILSADDVYDVIINDLFRMAELTYEGMFININNMENFDYSKTYWYSGYMEDLKLTNDRMFIMAGDYFMDVIGSCHALFYNKQMMESFYSDPDCVYNDVIDGSWTFDRFLTYVLGAYQDLNGDGKLNDGDQMGFTCNGRWGSAIPFMIAANITFIERSEDYTISFAFNNERSVTLLDYLNKIFYSDATQTAPSDASTDGLITLFGAEQTLFLGYQRLGYLEKMRDINFDIGVVPYPKMDDSQSNYVTSSHDTTEIGVIPVTVTDTDFVSACIEVCNRETQTYVIPAYYESALKVKYARDEATATMIDIIHDNFGSTFPLAYSTSLNSFLLSTAFANPLGSKSTDFASAYDKGESAALEKLQKIVDSVIENTPAS